MIKVAHLLSNKRVAHLSVESKEEAIADLVEVISASPAVRDDKALLEAMLERERIMTTGIGFGVALPHAKINSVSEFVMAIGICEKSIDFCSLDDEPVNIVVMIAGPHDNQRLYLRILSKVAGILKEKENREKILASQDPKEILNIFDVDIKQV